MRGSLLRYSTLPLLVLLGACRTTPPPALGPDEIQLYVESSNRGAREWQLPQSGVRILTERDAVVAAAGIVDVRVVPLDLGPALVLTLAPASAATLGHRLGSVTKRVVLVSRDHALGIARLAGDASVSQISMFVEMPPPELRIWAETIESRLRDRDRSRRE